jgi:uncharacterized protein (TIGR00661 family)
LTAIIQKEADLKLPFDEVPPMPIQKKRILVAPLNWGLGHATRCIPIIRALIELRFEPLLASDGEALQLLQKEFPELNAIELPSYNITYSEKGEKFKLKLIKDTPHVLKTIKKEKKRTKELVTKLGIDGIISDNRFGVRSKHIPSVFITHQLRVLSGSTTWLSTALHQQIIDKFDQCWVPDQDGEPNLSGDLGHLENRPGRLVYIGPLSRLEKTAVPPKYSLMVLLSGPEPQRSLLEEKLLAALHNYKQPCLFVRGKIEGLQTKETRGQVSIYNFLTSSELQEAINSSDIILCRSGYTTLMDLAKLEKKAFFIPTPGQFEQEYLAEKLMGDGIAPYASQDDFKLEFLEQVGYFKGFKSFTTNTDFEKLFSLFQSE